MKKVEEFFDPNRESPFFDYMKKVVVGQDVSWARRAVGPEVVGQDVTGAISLGQNFVGQDVRGAGRHWGKIPGAERRGARS